MPVGFPASSQGVGRFGTNGPPNTSTPSGLNPVTNQPNNVPFLESGPVWVIIFLVVGYILVFQTLR